MTGGQSLAVDIHRFAGKGFGFNQLAPVVQEFGEIHQASGNDRMSGRKHLSVHLQGLTGNQLGLLDLS